MSTKSYLEQARKHEFNAMQANLRGDKQLADRYESMARMSLIDSAECFNRENNYYNNKYYNNKYSGKCNIDFSGSPIPIIIGICSWFSFLAIICLIFS